MSDPGHRRSRLYEGREDALRPFVGHDGEAPSETAGEAPDPVEAAYARGVDDGRRAAEHDALERARSDLREHLAEIGRTLATLEDVRLRLIREGEARLLAIVVEATSRIVRQRLEDDDPIAARALREALDAAPKSKRLEARVHPDDAASVREALADALAGAELSVVEDGTVGRGGCVVDTGVGTLDATLGTATELVRDALSGGEETS